VQIERKKDDSNVELEGWLEKKGKWVRIFDVKTDQNDETEDTAGKYDPLVRCLVSANLEHSGWVTKQGKEWLRQPAGQVKMMLQDLGLS
jgi:hypothetical protein